MSRQPPDLRKQVLAQQREAEVAHVALMASEGMTHQERLAFFALCLRQARDPVGLELGIVGEEDWKCFRDLIGYAEQQLGPVETLVPDWDGVLDGIRREQARHLQAQLVMKGCRLRVGEGKLWVGPERLVSTEDRAAIVAVRDELAAMVEV